MGVSGQRTFAVAVTTCRRPEGVSYLGQALRSIRDAGFEVWTVVVDGPELVPRPAPNDLAAAVEPCDFQMGPKLCFKRALSSLLEEAVQWLIVFQDDVQVARGLRGWLEGPDNLPDDGVCSLYCSETLGANDAGYDAWWRLNLTPTDERPQPWYGSLGACALMLRPAVAEMFLEEDPQMGRTDRIGAALGEFCYKQGIPFWVHSPSLVEHVGEVSVNGKMPMTPERTAGRFCSDVSQL